MFREVGTVSHAATGAAVPSGSVSASSSARRARRAAEALASGPSAGVAVRSVFSSVFEVICVKGACCMKTSSAGSPVGSDVMRSDCV